MTGGKASRARGRRWQTACRQYLEHAGLIVHERPLGAPGDDLTVIIPGNGTTLSLEAKDQQRHDLAGWTDQATRQAPTGSIPIVIAHRRGRASPADGYTIMRTSDLLRLIQGLTHDRPLHP